MENNHGMGTDAESGQILCFIADNGEYIEKFGQGHCSAQGRQDFGLSQQKKGLICWPDVAGRDE